jgi:arylformamidase
MESIILLSHILDKNTPTYGDRDAFFIEENSEISKGDTANSSKWVFSTNHLGTHIDMPRHFFEEGKTLTDVPLDFWFSEKVQLIDIPCSNANLIEIEHLKSKIYIKTEVLLLRTGYDKYRNKDKYWNNNPGLSANLGVWLRKNFSNIKIIGFDFISLSSWKFREEGKKAHQTFLDPNGEGFPICVIEDMFLSGIKNYVNKIIIAPLFIDNSNGSPVTVFAKI